MAFNRQHICAKGADPAKSLLLNKRQIKQTQCHVTIRLTLTPNVTRSGLSTKSNHFFHGYVPYFTKFPPCVGSDDLKWPWKAGRERSKYSGDLHNYVHTFWPRITEFGAATRVERSIFLGVSHVPIPKGWGSSIPQIVATPYLCKSSLIHSDEISYNNTSGWAACFCGWTTPHVPKGRIPSHPKIL